MQSKIEEVKALLSPPSSPRNNSGDWTQVTNSLGTQLPTDYIEFTELYGSVKLCDYIVIHTAFPWSEEFGQLLLTMNSQYHAVVGGRINIPFSDYPAPGGLLPFGGTDNGDIFSWITNGSPDNWGVFVWIFPGLTTYRFEDRNLSKFLADLMNAQSPLLPDDMPEALFTPGHRDLVVTN